MPAAGRALRVFRVTMALVPGPVRRQHARRSLTTTAFRSEVAEASDPAVQAVVVPLDVYKVLQVSKSAGKDGVARAAARLVSATPDVNYSQAALQSREAVLTAASELLSEPRRRRAYDLSLGKGSPQARPPPLSGPTRPGRPFQSAPLGPCA